ncbi:MAG: universal stress protein [Gammaproteobacteria bacterium]|nr:universal stress protein [Gammaproteobacteria bacterium]
MYKNILFPVDMEHTVESADALAVALEEARRSNANLTVMTVAPGFGMPIVAAYFDEDAVKEALMEVARHLKKYIDDHIPDDIESTAVVVEGHPANLILEQAKENDVDLIVMASHNSELENLILGSCSARVVNHAPCTVTVVK